MVAFGLKVLGDKKELILDLDPVSLHTEATNKSYFGPTPFTKQMVFYMRSKLSSSYGSCSALGS